MEVAEFLFRGSFDSLRDSEVQLAIMHIETAWVGIDSLWSMLSTDDAVHKRILCKNYLIAWYIADMFPKRYSEGFTNGGAQLKAKTIDSIKIEFKDYFVQGTLTQLTTNAFGLRALDMLRACPDFYMVG